jgi:ankyrin repeat protein
MGKNARLAALMGILMTGTGCFPRPDTRLSIAAVEGDAAKVARLIGAGSPVDQPGAQGFTPLIWAARHGRTEAMAVLIDAGADVNRRDGWINGWTPLLHAIHHAQTGAVRLLIARGADVNAAAPCGLTPLIMAAGDCDCDARRNARDLDEIFSLLLKEGADPRAETRGGSNALTNAVAAGRTAIVRSLLAKAPDLRVGDGLRGEISLLLARLRGKEEILALVRKAGDDR